MSRDYKLMDREVNGRRRRLEDGEDVRAQKDGDSSNRRNFHHEAEVIPVIM
jgi:hypothetical protein